MPSIGSVPVRFRDRRFSNFHPVSETAHQALEAARQLAAAGLLGLVLIGRSGVGKTHLAAAVVAEIERQQDAAFREALARIDPGPGTANREWLMTMDPKRPCRPTPPGWCNVGDLIGDHRRDMGRPAEDHEATPVRLLQLHRALLVLDDLGREKVSDWTGEIVYSIVNRRYENKLATLVTSNMTQRELAASPYWPAISRLAEDGALVQIEADDYRLRRGA